MSNTALDILIRAKDEASRTIRGVGTSVHETATSVDKGSASMSRFGTASKEAGSRVKSAISGIAAGVGFVAVDELASKSLEAFDQLEVGEKRLGFGLQKIGESKDNLEGLVGWAKDFSNQTGVAESDIVGMESKLTAMGGAFLKAAGPQADTVLKKITSGMVNLGAATGKSASLLLRSLGPALMNEPATAATQLLKYGALTDAQVVKVKALVAAGKSHAASMMEINALYKKYSGVAAASETPMDKLKNMFNQLELTIGKQLNKAIPILVKVLTIAASVFHVLASAIPTPVIAAFAIALGTLGAVFLAQKVATLASTLATYAWSVATKAAAIASKAWAAAQWLLNAALDANPIALVVIAIAALVAGIIVAYKKSETFRNIVHDAFHVVAVAIDFVKAHWKLFALAFAAFFAPAIAAIVLLVTHFNTVKSAVQTVVAGVLHFFGNMVHFISGLPGRVAGFLSGMFAPLTNSIKTVIGWVQSLIGWIGKIHMPHIPGLSTVGKIAGGVGGFITHPHIPGLAGGGIVSRATLAVVGEAGPEAVIPLSRLKNMVGSGGGGVHVEIYNPTPEKASESVPRSLRELAYVHGIAW